MMFRQFIVLIFVLLLTLFGKHASGISCYQCLSTDHENPFQCNEFMTDADITPQPCESIYNAQYCVKHTGRFEGGIGTKRFCSPLDLGNYCNYIKQPGDVLEYRSCVYTCSSDGCNPADTIKPKFFSVLASVILIFIVVNVVWVR